MPESINPTTSTPSGVKPVEGDLVSYLALLEQIKARIDEGLRVTYPDVDAWFNVEYGALQLRSVLELLLYSSIVTNRFMLDTATEQLRKADANSARKLVESVNPDWWPVAITRSPTPDGFATEPKPIEATFRREEWGRTYGFVSDLVHPPNPYAPRTLSTLDCRLRIQGVLQRIVVLLDDHWIALPGGQWAFGAMMHETESGRPSGTILARAEDDGLDPS